MKKQAVLLMWALAGLVLQWLCRLRLLQPHKDGLHKGMPRQQRVIVSLTCYGRRVTSVLPFTLCSLMRQTCRPDKIVVWLDNEHWNDSNLPPCLDRYKALGVEFKFCPDYKSYKKLIPSLTEYANDLIVLTDDDLYYKSNTIELLVKAKQHAPQYVHGLRAHQPRQNADGTLASYNDWEMLTQRSDGMFPVFITTGGGTILEAKQLHPLTTDANLFMALSPQADDVWFWFMCLMAGTETRVVPLRHENFYPLDLFYQRLHSNSRLQDNNVNENANDRQIKAIMEHFNLKVGNLKRHDRQEN